LSGRGLCDELIIRPEESYRLCCVVVCDLETSRIGAPYIYDISRLRVNAHIMHNTVYYTLLRFSAHVGANTLYTHPYTSAWLLNGRHPTSDAYSTILAAKQSTWPQSLSTCYLSLQRQHKFKQINQLDVKISQVYYLTFMYSSTCFGRPHAHHQELNNCSSSLWFYRWSVVVAVLMVVVGPDHDHQHCYHHAPTVKPEAATAVVELLTMGVNSPETCWAVHKRQAINLRNCCI